MVEVLFALSEDPFFDPSLCPTAGVACQAPWRCLICHPAAWRRQGQGHPDVIPMALVFLLIATSHLNADSLMGIGVRGFPGLFVFQGGWSRSAAMAITYVTMEGIEFCLELVLLPCQAQGLLTGVSHGGRHRHWTTVGA